MKAAWPEARLQLEAVQEQMALTRHALNALIGQPNTALALVQGVDMACFFIPSVTITLSGLPYDKYA